MVGWPLTSKREKTGWEFECHVRKTKNVFHRDDFILHSSKAINRSFIKISHALGVTGGSTTADAMGAVATVQPAKAAAATQPTDNLPSLAVVDGFITGWDLGTVHALAADVARRMETIESFIMLLIINTNFDFFVVKVFDVYWSVVSLSGWDQWWDEGGVLPMRSVITKRGIWRPRDLENHPGIWKKNIPG